MDISLQVACVVLGVTALFGLAESAVTATPLTANLAENSAAGTTVATLAGSGETAPYTFLLEGSQNPDKAWFVISTAGVITVDTGKTIDYEATGLLTGKTYEIPVKVTDSAASPESAIVTVVVTITNVNECPSASNAVFTHTAALSGGDTVGTVAATDPESDTITYGVSGCNSAMFTVTTAGVLKVASASSLAVGSSNILMVTAKDDASTPLTCTANYLICVGSCSATCSGAISLTGTVLSIVSVLVLLMKYV